MLELATLIGDPEGAFPSTHSVCRDGAYTVDWRQLCRRVRHWRGAIEALPGSAVALAHTDADELLAQLLATWGLNRTAVLGADCPGDTASVRSATPPPETGGDVPALILYTSGSSGAPQPVAKHLRQLDAELAMLESAFGDRIGDSLLISTVSRHHMYGLAFALLWPLVRGNPFNRTSLHFLEALPTTAAGLPFTLVASPVQLANLPPHLDVATLGVEPALVFAAGAPLEAPAATDSHCKFATPVTEIYGSTETGAVAWRQSTADAAWRCLPGIAVDLDDTHRCLRVASPATSLGKEQWLTLADTATLLSGTRFRLLGRVDKIVKVAGKRISLTAIDRALEDHPLVKQARTLQLPERKGRIGAAMVLTAAGNAALIDRGKRALREQLAARLTRVIDSVAVPRYWRFVAALPVTAEGKIRSDTIRDLFVPERQPRLPQVLNRNASAEGLAAELELFVPHALRYFAGHFPGNGVLPGVVQIQWALHYAEQCLNATGTFQRLEAIKFQHVIQPGQVVTLSLQWNPDKGKLHFRFASPRAQHASGRIAFAHD